MYTILQLQLKTFQLSEGLAQGPYVAAKAEVEPMTLRTKSVDSTKAPPRSIYFREALIIYYYLRLLDKRR